MIKARQLGSRFSIRNLAAFSSWSTANSRLPNFSTDEDESGDSSSEVHRRAVTSKRPATVRWAPRLANSVQLIGSVERPVETIKSKTGQFGAYTILRAKNPLDSKQLTYKIMIVAWEDLAEICINHVKPGDFIYVSGLLAFYDNKDNYGSQSKIIVKELNFVDVSLYGIHPTAKKAELPNSGGLQQNDEPQVKLRCKSTKTIFGKHSFPTQTDGGICVETRNTIGPQILFTRIPAKDYG
ncbi:Protein OSB1, mitochondrial [Linum perenne]